METLNLILCFSKIESNRAEMHLNNIDIIDNIRQSVNTFKPAAQNKNLYLEFLSEQEPVIARLDETMFTRIMNNLLGNAIKFTHTGGVKVKVEIEDKKINPLVHILITDTGIGIESELQEVIFEPFRQASNGFSRKFEGTGLGLSITKRYVDLLNGTITLESEQGKGSCFRVSFPLEHISAVIPKGEIPVPAQVSSKVYKKTGNILPKVLLVEDDQINQIVIKISIKDFCTTEIADNGETALQMVRENNYDIILMDINLSGELNGLETTALIKQLPGYSNVPVVAVTAYAAADEKDSILNNGCDYFLAKPFTRVEITGLIKKILADKNDE
ncbi:MAG: hybrid sensor histidine kinase/response regulator [Methanococcaceae archaeon]